MKTENRQTEQRPGSTSISGVRSNKITLGQLINRQDWITVKGTHICIPSEKEFVHLQFRRFAGCPVCNMHLQSFARRYDELTAAGIHEVVVFHSSAKDLLISEDKIPFDLIADPDKRLYVKFGVESSPRAILNPQAWWPVIRAIVYSLGEIIRKQSAVPPINPAGGSFGLPADFLIDSNGRVIASKYGQHADDQWSVDELLAKVNAKQRTLLPA